MSSPARYMTHAERAKRRAAIKQALREGKHAPEVAAMFGVSRERVCQIARDAGIPQRSRGAPKGQLHWRECPEHLRNDYEHLVYRKRIGVEDARWLLEQRA